MSGIAKGLSTFENSVRRDYLGNFWLCLRMRILITLNSSLDYEVDDMQIEHGSMPSIAYMHCSLDTDTARER